MTSLRGVGALIRGPGEEELMSHALRLATLLQRARPWVVAGVTPGSPARDLAAALLAEIDAALKTT